MASKLYYPIYRFDPSLAFPELGSCAQSTADATVKSAGLSLTLAYLLSGNKFRGSLEHLTIDEIYHEIDAACFDLQIDIERVTAWAQSILIPPEIPGDDSFVPRRIDCKGFNLHPYQIKSAAWSAHRMGTVSALGCGVGKTATAVAAALAAARMGRCNKERCYIICPLNAMGTWEAYYKELEKEFEQVYIVSCDSLHKYKAIERAPGGAAIFDEVHRLKNHGAFRTGHAHEMRNAFEWAICLTGTLLHTGAEGVMSVLDLACPGLARFMDKWKFGEKFKCIIEKKVGKRKRHALGIPGMAVREDFVCYLMRGVWSRSNESEDVKTAFVIPGQNKLRIDSWERPDWVRKLDDEHVVAFRETAEKNGAKLTYSDEEIRLSDSPYIWIPEVSKIPDLLGMTAVALMHQEQEAWDQLVALVGPEQAGPKPGLPSFAAVFQNVSKLGRHDVIIKRTVDSEGKPIDYHFVYAPESSALEPAPGPKPKWVMQWLQENPEPVVIGAMSVPTIDAMQYLLKKEGIDYRLIRGGVSKEDRTEFIEGFQDGKFRVMLLQQVAGSESVTLTRAAVSILMDHDWSPITYTQFIARTCRQGQTQECDHYDLVFNELQHQIVQRLLRGEAFDAEARAQIEQTFNALMLGV